MANRCYYGLSKQLKSKANSRQTKLTLYKTLILLVLLCERKIYGPICVDGEYRRRMNHELYQLFSDIDIVRRIELQRLRWLGHVVRMEEDATAQKANQLMVHAEGEGHE